MPKGLDPSNPGIKYVQSRARLIIPQHKECGKHVSDMYPYYLVDDWGSKSGEFKTSKHYAATIVLHPDDLKVVSGIE